MTLLLINFVAEDDYLDVLDAVSPLSKKWDELCVALGLPLKKISAIRTANAGNSRESLHEGISQWLQGKYEPSWKKLVAALDRIKEHDMAVRIFAKHTIKSTLIVTITLITYTVKTKVEFHTKVGVFISSHVAPEF